MPSGVPSCARTSRTRCSTTSGSSPPLVSHKTMQSAPAPAAARSVARSEEHTSELQSRLHLVCRLLLEKKKKPDDAVRLHGLQRGALPRRSPTLEPDPAHR